MDITYARFNIGQIVQHKYYGFRGVIFDVDFEYSLDDQWFVEACEAMTTLGLPTIEKQQPFYHILTDGSDHESYVSEQNLKAATSSAPVEHEDLSELFSISKNGLYRPRYNVN